MTAISDNDDDDNNDDDDDADNNIDGYNNGRGQ